MESKFPKEGLFDLSAMDVMSEAERLYQEFFQAQTPISAYRLAVTLYHLAEWVSPNGNSKDYLKEIGTTDPAGEWKKELLDGLHTYRYYEILRSICDNSKHHTLSRSEAYEKFVERGFRAGRSVAGERLGQVNLAVMFNGEGVWLREVFSNVIGLHRKYFTRIGMFAAVKDALEGKQEI